MMAMAGEWSDQHRIPKLTMTVIEIGIATSDGKTARSGKAISVVACTAMGKPEVTAVSLLLSGIALDAWAECF